MEFKTLDELSDELNITKRLLMKWHRAGMKCVRQSVLMSTTEWVNEWRIELAERPKKEKVTTNFITYRPLSKMEDLKVH